MAILDIVIFYTYLGIVSASLIIGCIRYKTLSKNHFKYIVWLLLVILTIELYSRYYIITQKSSNAWAINIYLLIEFTIISYTYYRSFQTKLSQKLLTGAYLLSIAFGIFNIFLIQKSEFNSYNFILFSLLIIFYILEFIRQALISDKFSFQHDALFWFSIGGLLFFTGNIIVIGFISEWIKISMKLASDLYLINRILNIIYYFLVGAGLYLDNKSTKLTYEQ